MTLRRAAPVAVIALLFVTAAGVRLDDMNQPTYGFAIDREYFSALIARGYFFSGRESAPAWQRAAAADDLDQSDQIEPRVNERVVSWGWAIADGMKTWIPRALAIACWMIGAAFLLATALRLFRVEAAVVALGFFLLVPFGVAASRSFQPEPMLIALTLAALYAMVRHHQNPTQRALVVASAAAGLAVLVKPGFTLPLLAGAFAALCVSRRGWSPRALRELAVFAAIAAAPAGAYYVYGSVIESFLEGQTSAKFQPDLLDTRFYWEGWVKQVNNVVGAIPFIAALLGVVAARSDRRSLLIGMGLGYGAFGLIFTYHIATHDYYSLQLIPVVALALGALAQFAFDAIDRSTRAGVMRGVAFALIAAIAIVAGTRSDDEIATQRMQGFGGQTPEEHVGRADDIAEAVRHSQNVLFLDEHYGLTLEYHGWLDGTWWPRQVDLDVDAENSGGPASVPAAERLARLVDIREMPSAPDYFVITDPPEFFEQRDLIALLRRDAELIARERTFAVYRLNIDEIAPSAIGALMQTFFISRTANSRVGVGS